MTLELKDEAQTLLGQARANRTDGGLMLELPPRSGSAIRLC